MRGVRQPWLPEVKGVERIVQKRKTPEPQLRRFQSIKKFELLYHPFDLQFRLRLHRWLESNFRNKRKQLRELVGHKEYGRIKYYLYPQGRNRWLMQKQVARRMKEKNIYKFRYRLVTSLIKIWDNVRD